MKLTKNGLLFLFVIFLSALFYFNGISLNTPSEGSPLLDSRFNEWREDNTSIANTCNACHGDPSGNFPGSGTLTVFANNQATTSLTFDVDVTITGFTEAQGNDVTIGFIDVYENNSFFLDGGNDIHNSDVAVDPSGDLVVQNETVQLIAPSSPGNYSLKVHAIYTDTATDDYFWYINKTFDIEVVQPVDSDPPVIENVWMNGTTLTNNTKVGGEFLLRVNVTDPNLASVKYSLNGSDFEDLNQEGTTTIYNKTIDVSKLNNGSLSLFINAKDAVNNQANMTFNLLVENFGVSADIISYSTDKLISISDGVVDEIWDDFQAEKLFVSEFGSGGFILTAQNGFYIFALIVYESSNTWVSIEFDALPDTDNHMLDGHDGWTFGLGATQRQYVGDGYFIGGSGEPEDDFRDDILFETFEDESMTYVEMIRPFDTSDPDGHDVVFNSTAILDVQFASSSSHIGTGHNIYSWTISELTPSGGTVEPPPDDTGSSNPGELSDIVFVFSFTLVLATGLVHAGLRVVSRPIKHDKRIVQVDRLPDQPRFRDVIRRRKSKDN
ncbi:MAG: hypothetical protein ACW981_14715 [Candidatus Hodarchaeales archaeon]|jgi:hypothetical protein